MRCVAAGHAHWAMIGSRLDLAGDTREEIANQPAGFLVHALRDGELVSYQQAVTDAP